MAAILSRPQCVNRHVFGEKPWPKPILTKSQLEPKEYHSVEGQNRNIVLKHTLAIYCVQMAVPHAIDVVLTLWGRVTHICVGSLVIFGSDNGM